MHLLTKHDDINVIKALVLFAGEVETSAILEESILVTAQLAAVLPFHVNVSRLDVPQGTQATPIQIHYGLEKVIVGTSSHSHMLPTSNICPPNKATFFAGKLSVILLYF